ncbi:MAG: diguanylate cyclase [Gemmatimonadetes bacterium]|jgi:two-component system, cell cycle response regulator|nr:diguanylate cyclase [Gemmatimonadota bacterium]MBT6148260.1 diguanylate cyclase [Gemmatimonadota bacterium]MBT7863402.1 diguanylate cyclase [Gemmatimonadota bacterium]
MSQILIVSADERVADEIRQALPDEMYGLVRSTDIEDGFQHLDGGEGRCDLILYDLRISEAEAAQRGLARYVDRAGSMDTPVVAMSDATDPGTWVPWLHAGAVDHICVAPINSDVLAAKISVLLRIKERLDQLRAEAVIDELTGVHNRRYLDEQLGARLGEAARYEMPFSIGLLDIDHFKLVNDGHGHLAGDRVLQDTAGIIRKQMRKEDVLVRYGGEEFAVMLPQTDRLGAAILAERIREAIAEHEFDVDGKILRITVSVGVASYPLDDCTQPEELVAISDKRLYEAKDAGRNQSVFE